MFRVLIATVLIAVTASLAHAQNVDAIEKRQAAYKAMLPQVKIGKQMLTGKQAFDVTAATKIFATYAETAKTLKPLFPEDSKSGKKTAALPAIWENKADFEAKLAKFEKEATEAIGTITDFASFKAAWGNVMSNCGGCHKPYRAKDK
jgi:cytochrome c556